jgi:biotin carboxyl carrier protein
MAPEEQMSMRRYTVSVDERPFTIDVIETAADRFEVSVDGRTFEATLHDDRDLPGSVISPEIAAPAARAAAPPATGAAPSTASPTSPVVPSPPARRPATPAPGPASRGHDSGGRADVMTAPMPGVVLEVLVAAGATLGRGDPVLVLEAMKMRNTIRCPRDSVVVEVAVAAGQPVGPGDLLVRLADAAQ